MNIKQEINSSNAKGMQALMNGIDYYVNDNIRYAPFDKTYIGMVADTDPETNTYTVTIDGYDYENVMSTIRAYPKETVLVMCPQNQLSQMFIYGKIDTTDYS